METTIIWDEVGSRTYESGIDRGVIYPANGVGVPWNGITSVSEKLEGNETTALYFEGVKYAEEVVPGEYAATISAYTYPDELVEFEGNLEVGNGLFVTGQRPKRFGLSYRTKIGNDEDGDNAGYKIHVVYNLLAVPSSRNYSSINNSTSPLEFQWDVTAIPSEIPGYRPTAHLIFDSRKIEANLFADLEATLYGDGSTDATLPAASTLAGFISSWVVIRIIDNQDGTWTAEAEGNYIEMVDATTYKINNANTKTLDVNSYSISNLTY